MSSNKQDWATPDYIFEWADEKFGPITLDVCATANNTKCSTYFSTEVDGLVMDWHGTCWMNPPYGADITHWVKKAAEESRTGQTKVIGLLPARTDTKWWHDYVAPYCNIYFLQGRIKFKGADSSAPFPSAIAEWRSWANSSPEVYHIKHPKR